jgi:hypothetical protein
MIPGLSSRRRFSDLTEQEILALAERKTSDLFRHLLITIKEIWRL